MPFKDLIIELYLIKYEKILNGERSGKEYLPIKKIGRVMGITYFVSHFLVMIHAGQKFTSPAISGITPK